MCQWRDDSKEARANTNQPSPAVPHFATALEGSFPASPVSFSRFSYVFHDLLFKFKLTLEPDSRLHVSSTNARRTRRVGHRRLLRPVSITEGLLTRRGAAEEGWEGVRPARGSGAGLRLYRPCSHDHPREDPPPSAILHSRRRPEAGSRLCESQTYSEKPPPPGIPTALERLANILFLKNGNDLINLISTLKPQLHDRYEKWVANGSKPVYEDDEDDDYEQQARYEEHQRKEQRRQQAAQQARLQEEDAYRRRDAEERERTYRRKQEEKERELREVDEIKIAKDQARAVRQRQAEEYHKASRRREDEIRSQRRMKEDQTFAYVNSAVASNYDARSSYDRGRDGREPMGPRHMSPENGNGINYPPINPPSGINYVTPPNRQTDLDFSSPGPLPLESPSHMQYREPVDDGEPYYASGSGNVPRR